MESHRNQPRAVVCGSWPRRTLRPDLCRCLARVVYRPLAKRVERPWISAAMCLVGVSSTGFDRDFQLPLSRLLGEGCAAVRGLVLDWWDEPDLPMDIRVIDQATQPCSGE